MKEFMVLIERIVRPVRASASYKFRMREELLLHLTTLFEEERARLNDDSTAAAEAVCRFGIPAQLTQELQSAVPRHERICYYLDRWFDWRPRESVAQYMLRLTAQLLLISAVPCCLLAAPILLLAGWDDNVWTKLRPAFAFLVGVHIDLYLLGLLYFKMRDALCAGFVICRSPLRASLFAGLFAMVVAGSGLGYIAIAEWNVAPAVRLLLPCCAVAIVAPITYGFYALLYGPIEIRQAQWAGLDIAGGNTRTTSGPNS